MDIANLDKKLDLSEGEWIDDIPDNPGLRLKVRSTNYKPFRVATAGLARRSGKQLNTDEGLADFTVSAGKPLAEHILLDWDGVNSNGKAVKYKPDIALALLTADDDLGIGNKFRRAVEYAADQVADRLAKQTEDAKGN
jgi:hypothetical protein|tara:strand:+ start:31470 stop:31883 length:414 start_codon:yes stop_codon:yes gene_type:complete